MNEFEDSFVSTDKNNPVIFPDTWILDNHRNIQTRECRGQTKWLRRHRPGLDVVQRLGEVDHEGGEKVEDSSLFLRQFLLWQSKYFEKVFPRFWSSEGEGALAAIIVVQSTETVVVVLIVL